MTSRSNTVWGECTHVFHMHCLLQWIGTSSSKQQCPMDRRPWGECICIISFRQLLTFRGSYCGKEDRPLGPLPTFSNMYEYAFLTCSYVGSRIFHCIMDRVSSISSYSKHYSCTVMSSMLFMNLVGFIMFSWMKRPSHQQRSASFTHGA